MDLRSSKNSAICFTFSDVLFSKSMCAKILENLLCDACGLISVLSGKNLTNFTMFSVDMVLQVEVGVEQWEVLVSQNIEPNYYHTPPSANSAAS